MDDSNNNFNKGESNSFWKTKIFQWLIFIVVIFFTVIICVKILECDFCSAFSTFEFSTVLSLLLAFFAIGISIAFYFKSTDSSNKFYHDSHIFTQHMRESISRMETGFTEKLAYIGEQMTKKVALESDKTGKVVELSTLIETIFDNSNLAEEEREKFRARLKDKNEDEFKDILEELLQKTKIQSPVKDTLKSQILLKDSQIRNLENELNYLKKRNSHSGTFVNFDDNINSNVYVNRGVYIKPTNPDDYNTLYNIIAKYPPFGKYGKGGTVNKEIMISAPITDYYSVGDILNKLKIAPNVPNFIYFFN